MQKREFLCVFCVCVVGGNASRLSHTKLTHKPQTNNKYKNRYERSGTLHGLMRVRGFTQDDAHIFCLPSQLQDEIRGVLDLVESILSKFGFSDYEVMLSTRPEKSVGTDEIWDAATEALVGMCVYVCVFFVTPRV